MTDGLLPIYISTERRWVVNRFIIEDKGEFCHCGEWDEEWDGGCTCGLPKQTYTDLGIDKITRLPSMHDIVFAPPIELSNMLPKYLWNKSGFKVQK